VNETMARQFWGSADAAMGRVFRMDEIDYRIIGVAENGKYEFLQEPPMPFLFVATPFVRRSEGTLLIETAAPPSAMVGAIRKAIHDTDPDAQVVSLATLRQNLRLSLFAYRIAAGLIGTIAILGIFLAGVGLYGLVAYSVMRRTHEIGIRVAMGAGPAEVLGLVFRETASRLAMGSGIGLAVALAAAQVLRSALYGVSPADPMDSPLLLQWRLWSRRLPRTFRDVGPSEYVQWTPCGNSSLALNSSSIRITLDHDRRSALPATLRSVLCVRHSVSRRSPRAPIPPSSS
jgi:ABC-type antimicrobial peptide transport system permease subunit